MTVSSPLAQLVEMLMVEPATARHTFATTIAVLIQVAATPGASVKDVAEAIGRPPRAVTDSCSLLESRGLLRRRQHPEDHRRVVLALTPAGREVYGRMCCAVGGAP